MSWDLKPTPIFSIQRALIYESAMTCSSALYRPAKEEGENNMNKYMKYAVKKFKKQFHYTGKGHNVIEDVMFYTDYKYNELRAKVTYVSEEQQVFTFFPEDCTWECLPFD